MRYAPIVVVLFVCCSCASAVASPILSSVGSGRDYEPYFNEDEPVANRARALAGALVVPPDRALVAVEIAIDVEGGLARGEADLSAHIARLTRALSSAPGCSAVAMDAQPASSDGERARARATFVVEQSLTGLTTVDARRAKVAACHAALASVGQPLNAGYAKIVADEPAPIRFGAWRVVVDRPDAHLPALLQAHAARLASITVKDPPPALVLSGLRCTPVDRAQVVSATLAGVELALDLVCVQHPSGYDEGEPAEPAPDGEG